MATVSSSGCLESTFNTLENQIMRMSFVLRIRTIDGGIIGNIVVQAHDQFEAVNIVQQRYPGCTILNCEMK